MKKSMLFFGASVALFVCSMLLPNTAFCQDSGDATTIRKSITTTSDGAVLTLFKGKMKHTVSVQSTRGGAFTTLTPVDSDAGAGDDSPVVVKICQPGSYQIKIEVDVASDDAVVIKTPKTCRG